MPSPSAASTSPSSSSPFSLRRIAVPAFGPSLLFGIGEGAIRTALWRMVGAGELTAEVGWYRLAGRLLDRQERVDESTVPHRRPWDGTWVLAVGHGLSLIHI